MTRCCDIRGKGQSHEYISTEMGVICAWCSDLAPSVLTVDQAEREMSKNGGLYETTVVMSRPFRFFVGRRLQEITKCAFVPFSALTPAGRDALAKESGE